MADKYGPTRGELWFRLCAGLAGLGFLAIAITWRGVPSGPALVEVLGFGGVFFGGTVVWSGTQLWKQRAG